MTCVHGYHHGTHHPQHDWRVRAMATQVSPTVLKLLKGPTWAAHALWVVAMGRTSIGIFYLKHLGLFLFLKPAIIASPRAFRDYAAADHI
jgi:hypothetical protein